MLFGQREPRSSGLGRRGAFRPSGEDLEFRQLLAGLIDLGGAPPGPGVDTLNATTPRSVQLPAITGDKLSTAPGVPLGVDLAGTLNGQSAGFSVRDVGDVNGDSFDDFLVGAPSVNTPGGGSSSSPATVYLIFGSRTTNGGTISDWLRINANFTGGEAAPVGVGRVGNLNQLGNSPATQTDPYNGLNVGLSGVAYAYPFSGLKFVTSQTPGSELGEGVGAAFGANNERGFIIGAPGPGTTSGSGRAFLISGASALNSLANSTIPTIDLDNLTASGLGGLNVTTFLNSAPGSRTGQSVGGIGDFIPDGFQDVAIGAPEATVNGAVGSGAVYVVSGAALSTGLNVVNLSGVGQGVTAGVVFGGAAAGDELGWSLAGAGNVNGALTSANQAVNDLLIGAPSRLAGGTGSAYLIYGQASFTSFLVTD